MLRKKGVVDKFVEFFGDGLANLPLADRATIANMAPEYGSTCGIFPIDEETLRYLELSGRPAEQIALVEAYAKAQGMWRIQRRQARRLHRRARTGSRHGRAQPRRTRSARRIACRCPRPRASTRPRSRPWPRSAPRRIRPPPATPKSCSTASRSEIRDGAVMIAAITSCTNTSNPYVLMAAGLLARNAAKLGLKAKPWVKTSLAPGSRVVTDYLTKAGLLAPARIHRLQCGRLRLHHLHRQFRSAEARDLRRHQGGRHRRHLGAVGQSQFRRPRASGSEDELPRLAAAGGGLRAGRHHGHRSAERRAGHRSRWQAGAARQHLALRQGSRTTRCMQTLDSSMFRKSYAQRVHRRRQLVVDQGAGRQDLRLGREVHLRAQSALLRRHDHDADAGHRRHRRAMPGVARRFGHHRSHLARRRHRQDQPGREVPGVAGRAAGRFQLLRRASRQSRSDDARHLRQHPPAQPAGAGHRRRRHGARARAASRCPSSTRPCATRRTARRW